MRSRIRGALFDKDGTLIDFAATWRGVVDELIRAYAGDEPPLADSLGAAIGYDRRTGRFLPGSPVVAGSTGEVAALMAALLPRASAAEIEAEANRRAAAAGAGDEAGLQPTPGLLPAIRRLREMGLALGVATHDSEAAARAHLRHLGLAGAFGFYAGYDSGHGLKPGPGMIRAFCARAGLEPREVVMTGDSLHDLGAARAAGCAAAVAVLTGPAAEDDLRAHADVVLPSVAALPDWLIERFPA